MPKKVAILIQYLVTPLLVYILLKVYLVFLERTFALTKQYFQFYKCGLVAIQARMIQDIYDLWENKRHFDSNEVQDENYCYFDL
jgi:hypothetical protein